MNILKVTVSSFHALPDVFGNDTVVQASTDQGKAFLMERRRREIERLLAGDLKPIGKTN